MNLSVCTISFRHQLISLQAIACWALQHRFSGIELWGVHAKGLCEETDCDRGWLRDHKLFVPMISDYLPVDGDHETALGKAADLSRMARSWGATKLRTFAGNRASTEVTVEQRRAWVSRMRELCAVAYAHGVYLVVETHPDTLADTLASTLQLVEEIDHDALRLNFDVLHVWQGGAEPAEAFRLLEPVIAHMHLKNVEHRAFLPVFAPQNVYAPAGERRGMVGLFEGAYDYHAFLSVMRTHFPATWQALDASLEWFGPDVLSNLERDGQRLQQLCADEWEWGDGPVRRTGSLP